MNIFCPTLRLLKSGFYRHCRPLERDVLVHYLMIRVEKRTPKTGLEPAFSIRQWISLSISLENLQQSVGEGFS